MDTPNYPKRNKKYTPVSITFKSDKDFECVYHIHLRDLKDSVMALNDKAGLTQARLELSELLAIVDHKLFNLREADEIRRFNSHEFNQEK